MGKYFGTDGVRGIANSELTAMLAMGLGRAAGSLLRESGRERVVVGRDTRASGEMLESALAAGLCSSGADVIRVGVIPTPGIAYLCKYLDAGAGVVVTASHNPAPDNGIKFFGPDGLKLPDETEDEIEGRLEALDSLPSPIGAEVGRIQERRDLVHLYGQQVRYTIPHRLDGLKIVLDCANGATSVVAAEIIQDLGGEVTVMNDRPNGLNINDACGSLYPQKMQQAVRDAGADLGAAFDGDGDRCILCDESGELVDGDRVMAIYALNWAGSFKLPGNVVVGTVMSNLGLELALKKAGITFRRAPVGDRYVSEQMRKLGAAVGGEKSGHIIFAEHGTTGDGLVTMLQTLGCMRATRRPLSELAAQVKELPQLLVNVRVSRKEGWDDEPAVKAAMDQAAAELKDGGRLLVRPSGTEKLIRVMAEGPDQAQLERLVYSIRDALLESLGEE
ncbi:MAG TPA: phosphoglucosamine mutase [Armatimonadota bacterium]